MHVLIVEVPLFKTFTTLYKHYAYVFGYTMFKGKRGKSLTFYVNLPQTILLR